MPWRATPAVSSSTFFESRSRYFFLLPHPPHTQLHPPPLPIHLQHPHLHHLPHSNHRQRIFHIPIRQFRDMHQPILLDADINESTKIHHITHSSLQNHTRL